MYKDTPTRCPLCGYIMGRIRTMHFLTKKGGEEVVENMEEERRKLLVQIEELRERIARL